jgi:lipopolysaccharide/colanic/teichoic acid biosynthesis glycosyltransferase
MFAFLIRLAITISSRLAMLKAFVRPLAVALVDIVFVDCSIFLAELVWFGTIFRLQPYAYPIVYTVPALIVVVGLYSAGVYTHRRMSASRSMVSTIVSFVVISALVFFFKDYGFSRAVTIISGFLSAMLLPGWRLLLRALGGSSAEGRKSILGRRTLIVGTDKSAQELLRRLRSRVSDGYDVLGFVDVNRKRIGEELAGLPIVGSTDNIGKVIQDMKVTDVIFSTQTLLFADILSVIGRTREQSVNFHLVPNTMEVIIGKGSVDSLDELPLVQITYNIEKSTNRTLKRLFDICISGALLISMYPFLYLKKVLTGRSRSRFILRVPSVLGGSLSLVGPPETQRGAMKGSNLEGGLFLGKPGLTGLIQLQGNRVLEEQEKERYNLYYAKNQSLVLDVEILLKTMLRSRSTA